MPSWEAWGVHSNNNDDDAMFLGAVEGGGVHSNNNDNDVTDRDEYHKDDNDDTNMQQPTLWSDLFQAERGWGGFYDNDYVKDDEDEPRQGQGQGKQSGGGGGFQI